LVTPDGFLASHIRRNSQNDMYELLAEPILPCDHDEGNDNVCWRCRPGVFAIPECARGHVGCTDESHCNVEVCSIQTSRADQLVELVHRRLGHLGTNNLIRLGQEKMVKNLGVSWQVLKKYRY